MNTLEGADLDAAVARAEGYELDEYGENRTIREYGGAPSAWNPSTSWLQAGPIIERERIAVITAPLGTWAACTPRQAGLSVDDDGIILRGEWSTGPTPLIAAMRAYVASCHLTPPTT